MLALRVLWPLALVYCAQVMGANFLECATDMDWTPPPTSPHHTPRKRPHPYDLTDSDDALCHAIHQSKISACSGKDGEEFFDIIIKNDPIGDRALFCTTSSTPGYTTTLPNATLHLRPQITSDEIIEFCRNFKYFTTFIPKSLGAISIETSHAHNNTQITITRIDKSQTKKFEYVFLATGAQFAIHTYLLTGDSLPSPQTAKSLLVVFPNAISGALVQTHISDGTNVIWGDGLYIDQKHQIIKHGGLSLPLHNVLQKDRLPCLQLHMGENHLSLETSSFQSEFSPLFHHWIISAPSQWIPCALP